MRWAYSAAPKPQRANQRRKLTYILHRLKCATMASVVNTRQKLQVNNILRRLHIVHLKTFVTRLSLN